MLKPPGPLAAKAPPFPTYLATVLCSQSLSSASMSSDLAPARPDRHLYMLAHACRTAFVVAVTASLTAVIMSMRALPTLSRLTLCTLARASIAASPLSGCDCVWKPKPPRARTSAGRVNLLPLSVPLVGLTSWLLAALVAASHLAFDHACLSKNCCFCTLKPSSPRSLRSSASPLLPWSNAQLATSHLPPKTLRYQYLLSAGLLFLWGLVG